MAGGADIRFQWGALYLCHSSGLHSMHSTSHGNEVVPESLTLHDSLDTFQSFYVNKFIDHHAFEIAS